MNKLALAVAATAMLGATGAVAQGVEFRLGAPGWDNGWHHGWRQRHRYRDVDQTAGLGCRTITVRSEDDYGNTRIKRIRRCD